MIGATRWYICSKDVRQGQKQHPHTCEDGQCYCNSVHKPPGRNEVSSLSSPSMSSLAVVPVQRDHTLSRSSTRDIQQYSRQRIPHLPFISRVEAAHHSLQSDLSMIGPMQCGPLYKQAQQPAGSVHVCQLASRLLCNCDGCFPDIMAQYPWICLPTFLSGREN